MLYLSLWIQILKQDIGTLTKRTTLNKISTWNWEAAYYILYAFLWIKIQMLNQDTEIQTKRSILNKVTK